MHKSQIFFAGLVAFVFGVFIASFVRFPLEVWLGILFLGLIFLSIYTASKVSKKTQTMMLAVILVSCSIGGLRFQSKFQNFTVPADEFLNKTVIIEGVVVSDPEDSLTFSNFILEIEGGVKVLVRGSRFEDPPAGRAGFEYGHKLVLRGKLRLPENFADFDYIGYLRKDGVSVEMIDPQIVKHEVGAPSLRRNLYAFKDWFVSNIRRVAPEPYASVLAGVTVGERRGIPRDIMQTFIDSGTVHILALSGYNISLIGRAVAGALRGSYASPLLSFWLSTILIFCFVVATGASASVVRAGIMGVLVLLAHLRGRQYASPNALLFVAAVMVFENPLILKFDRGFLLSAFATAGLIFVLPKLEKIFPFVLKKGPRLLRDGFLKIKEATLATIAAQLAVLPLLLEMSGHISASALPANILIVLVVPFSMFLGFTLGFFGFLGFLLLPIVGIAWLAVGYELLVAKVFAETPLASMYFGSLSLFVVFLFYIVLILYIFWRKRSRSFS